MSNPIITLTTDYGTSDHFVGTLKGVILKINPNVIIVDITHQIAQYDLLDAAMTIGTVYPYYPPFTIHLVVVDPGVGTARRPLIVSASNQYFVAPDNGVLSLIYEQDENAVARHANAEHYYLHPVCRTFHGRDIFAPVAAWLSKNWQPASMGEEVTDHKRLVLPKPKIVDGRLKGLVLHVDNFGNMITNLRAEHLPEEAVNNGAVKMQIGNQPITKLLPTFAVGVAEELFAFIGSSGFVEIAINKASAAERLGLGKGTPVFLEKDKSTEQKEKTPAQEDGQLKEPT